MGKPQLAANSLRPLTTPHSGTAEKIGRRGMRKLMGGDIRQGGRLLIDFVGKTGLTWGKLA